MKKIILVCVVLLILVIGGVGGWYIWQRPQPSITTPNGSPQLSGNGIPEGMAEEKVGELQSYLYTKNADKLQFTPQNFPVSTKNNSLEISLKYNDAPLMLSFPVASGSAVLDGNELRGGDIFFQVASLTSTNASSEILEDLRSGAFLDGANFPNIKFSSRGLRFLEDRTELTGELTIKGIKQAIYFPVTSTDQGYQGTYEVVLSSYGITDSTVSPTVVVNFSITTK